MRKFVRSDALPGARAVGAALGNGNWRETRGNEVGIAGNIVDGSSIMSINNYNGLDVTLVVENGFRCAMTGAAAAIMLRLARQGDNL